MMSGIGPAVVVPAEPMPRSFAVRHVQSGTLPHDLPCPFDGVSLGTSEDSGGKDVEDSGGTAREIQRRATTVLRIATGGGDGESSKPVAVTSTLAAGYTAVASASCSVKVSRK